MSETFVHVAPRDKWRPGWTKERLIEAMRAVVDRDSRRDLQLFRPHQGQRRGSRQRRSRAGRAEDLRHQSGPHERDTRAVRRRPWQAAGHCRPRALPRCERAAASDRARPWIAGARRHQRERRRGRRANRPRRKCRHDVLGERAPGAGSPDLPAGGKGRRGADRPHPRANGERRTCAAERGRPHREGGRQGQHHARSQQPRPCAQVQCGRPGPRLCRHRRHRGREAGREGTRRQLPRLGRRVREPEAGTRAAGRDHSHSRFSLCSCCCSWRSARSAAHSPFSWLRRSP